MDDARRSRLADSIFGTCTAEEVAGQIALFGAPRFHKVYVERREDGYRWSIVHGGGPYPLLRELAQLLDIPYQSIVLPFATLDGWAYVLAPDIEGEPDSCAFIESSADASVNVERLLAATAG